MGVIILLALAAFFAELGTALSAALPCSGHGIVSGSLCLCHPFWANGTECDNRATLLPSQWNIFGNGQLEEVSYGRLFRDWGWRVALFA
jgi:hypothetical protein